ILSGLDGTIVAETLHRGSQEGNVRSGGKLPFASVLESAAEKGESEIAAIVFLEGRPDQVVVVPLLAPVRAASICVGVLRDDAFVSECGRQTRLQVSVLTSGPNGARRVFATPLRAAAAGALPAALEASRLAEGRSDTLDLGGEAFVTRVASLGGGDGVI